MPIRFQLLPSRNLILFDYSGHIVLSEPAAAVQAAAQAAAYRPGMRHLVDVSQVTGVDRDWPALLRQQAEIAAVMVPQGPEQLVLFYAPNRPGQWMAQMARRSWEGLNIVSVRVIEDETEALALLGLPERSIAALRASEPGPAA